MLLKDSLWRINDHAPSDECGNECRQNAAFCVTRARRLAIACGVCAWLAAGAVSAQVVAQRTWPETGRDLWYWVAPQTDFSSEQVGSAFKRALEEELAFLDPAFSTTVFFAKKIRVTTGKAGARKKYKDQPAKADVLRLEVEWQTGYLNQYRGTAYRFIALDSLRSIDLHYLPDLRQRFPRAPAGGNWNVNIYAGSLYNFFFRTEDTARNFIDALASLLKLRDLGVTFSRFGLMWENVTPAQAAEIGRAGVGGVLVTMVAIAGPADQAGIRPLDVVREVNGTVVKNFSHFSLLLDGIAPGAGWSLLLLRSLKSPPGRDDWNLLTVKMEAR